mgnify:CR=1 FL=1
MKFTGDEFRLRDISCRAIVKHLCDHPGQTRAGLAQQLALLNRTPVVALVTKTDKANPAQVAEQLLAQGADLVMVKPALAYLDVLRQVRDGRIVAIAATAPTTAHNASAPAMANAPSDAPATIRTTASVPYSIASAPKRRPNSEAHISAPSDRRTARLVACRRAHAETNSTEPDATTAATPNTRSKTAASFSPAVRIDEKQ